MNKETLKQDVISNLSEKYDVTADKAESYQLHDALSKAVEAGNPKSANVVLIGAMAKTTDIEKDIWLKHKENPNFALIGIDRDEPLETVIEFGKKTGITYPMALDPGADIFAKYADRQAGITRNVLVDKDGKIVMLTRLYNEEEFAALCKKIDEMLAQ